MTAATPRIHPFFSRPSLHLLLIAVAITAVLGLQIRDEIRVAGGPGFTMDDSWIHLTMAKNLVEGHGFSINRGETLPVSTSPTWTLIEAFFFLFFREPVVAGLVTSLLCSVLAAGITYLTLRQMTDSPLTGLVGASLLMFNPISLWGLGSGMELPLILLALSLVFYFAFHGPLESRSRRFGLPAALAFAAVTRPELFAVIPIALFDTLLHGVQEEYKSRRREVFVTLACQVGTVALLLCPYFLFNYLTISHLFPTTFYAKATVRGVGITAALGSGNIEGFLGDAIRQIRLQFITLFSVLSKLDLIFYLLFPIGLLFFARKFHPQQKHLGILLPLSFLALPAAMALVAPPNAMANTMNRYYTIFIPFFAVSAALGWHILRSHCNLRLVPFAILALALIYQVGNQIPGMAKRVARDVNTNQRLYVDMGRWIAENLEPDARMAVNDIGGVAYFMENRKLLDVMGLASPEIWPILQARKNRRDVSTIKEYMRQQKIQYLVISPHYYPLLAKDETFEEIKRFAIDYRINHQWSPQIIYRCNWQKSE